MIVILLMQRRYVSACLMFVVMCWSTGCTTMPLNVWQKPAFQQEDPNHPVVEVVGIWQTADGQDERGFPSRGFGGQLLFFAAGYKSPVKIDGDVSIYIFDDHGSVEEQSRPFKQYDFTSEDWQQFFRDSNLGPCYQVFVPYTRKGGLEADCSLRIKYTPKNANPVFSKVATIKLRGLNKDPENRFVKKIPQPSHQIVQAGATVTSSTSEESSQLRQLSGEVALTPHSLGSTETISTAIQQPKPMTDLQHQRIESLENLLDTFKADAKPITPKYEVTHSRKVAGKSLDEMLDGQEAKLDNESLGASSTKQ